MPSKRTAHQARARRNRAAVQQWEDKLDLRREVLIAVVGIPAGTVLAWLLAWHRAFVEPLWGSPVSALLIVAVAAAVVAGAWHFVLREENRWWTGVASVVHLPLVVSPFVVLDGAEALALQERGVVEQCLVLRTEQFVARSRSGNETMVRHWVRCSTGTYEEVTPVDRRRETGSWTTVHYDSAGVVAASFDEPEGAAVRPVAATAAVALVAAVGLRVAYVWWRVRRRSAR